MTKNSASKTGTVQGNVLTDAEEYTKMTSSGKLTNETYTDHEKGYQNPKGVVDSDDDINANELAYNQEVLHGVWVRGGEKGYFLTMGDKRISQMYAQPWMAENEANQPNINTICNVISIVLDARIKLDLKAIEELRKSKTEVTAGQTGL